jgi:RimJ/RimL family protein N-acetyltransferase
VKNVEIADDLLCLRRARMSEAPLLARAVQDSLSELEAYLPWASPDYDVRAARDFLDFAREQARNDRGFHLNVFGVADGQLIGGVGLMLRPVNQSAELGYWVRSDRAGQGLATHAASLLLREAIGRLALRRVYLTCDVKNRGSRRVAEKLGMRREGRLRGYFLIHGQSRDHYLYALLASEFRPSFVG